MFPRRTSPQRARELSAFKAHPAASQGGASVLAATSWEQQASQNMFLIVQINLGSPWSLLVAEQGKQRCLCTVAAAAVHEQWEMFSITWSRTRHFKYLSVPIVLVLLHLNLSRICLPHFQQITKWMSFRQWFFQVNLFFFPHFLRLSLLDCSEPQDQPTTL